MNREVMEEASMKIKDPILVEVIESDYFDDHISYMLMYGVLVDELLDFKSNDESTERLVVSTTDFIQRYEAGDKKLMQKSVVLAWQLLCERFKLRRKGLLSDEQSVDV